MLNDEEIVKSIKNIPSKFMALFGAREVVGYTHKEREEFLDGESYERGIQDTINWLNSAEGQKMANDVLARRVKGF